MSHLLGGASEAILRFPAVDEFELDDDYYQGEELPPDYDDLDFSDGFDSDYQDPDWDQEEDQSCDVYLCGSNHAFLEKWYRQNYHRLADQLEWFVTNVGVYCFECNTLLVDTQIGIGQGALGNDIYWCPHCYLGRFLTHAGADLAEDNFCQEEELIQILRIEYQYLRKMFEHDHQDHCFHCLEETDQLVSFQGLSQMDLSVCRHCFPKLRNYDQSMFLSDDQKKHLRKEVNYQSMMLDTHEMRVNAWKNREILRCQEDYSWLVIPYKPPQDLSDDSDDD